MNARARAETLIAALRAAREAKEAAFDAWVAEVQAGGPLDGPTHARYAAAEDRMADLLRQAARALGELELLAALNPGVDPRSIPF